MGVTPWDSSLNIEDAVTGWSAQKFVEIFKVSGLWRFSFTKEIDHFRKNPNSNFSPVLELF